MDDTASDAAPHLGFSASLAAGPGPACTVTVIGELDVASAPGLRGVLERAIERGGPVELDLRACSFVDSTGIATIVGAARALHERGDLLRVRGASLRVRRILELAGLVDEHWIEIEPAPPG